MDKTLICKFWLKGRCDRTDNCRYAHGEEEKKRACSLLPCHFLKTRGRCRLGSECMYAHSEDNEPLGALSAEVAEVRTDPELTSLTGDASESQKDVEQDHAPKERQVYKEAWQRGQFDKTRICSFWQHRRCQRGDECKYAHGEEEQRKACGRIPCREFLQRGICDLGSECWYTHGESNKSGDEAARDRSLTAISSASTSASSTPSAYPDSDLESKEASCTKELDSHWGGAPAGKTLLCSFWLEGRCERGSACRYAHSEVEKKEACRLIQCQYYAKGHCRLGSDCLYLHSADLVLRKEAESGNDEGKSSTSTEVGDMEFLGSSSSVLSEGAESEPQELPAGNFDKTRLCKFWQKRKCQRGSDCKFAHSEEEQQKACGKIMCRKVQEDEGCPDGPACLFAHPKQQADLPKVSKATAIALVDPRPRTGTWPCMTTPILKPSVPDSSALSSPWLKSIPCPRMAWADLADGDDEELLAPAA
eukprot:TRINITY_DN103129_c0_g1_i1.p1 TRINITY_DN103129_c0_g1~~TRINITY_DN103129_c0_g1_i1.p1  ORF type:complete len:476 (-),score=58.46 TRINITY_DN103129_c0_g1_i1:159-1586(-)